MLGHWYIPLLGQEPTGLSGCKYAGILSAYAIAVQGIGFSPCVTAVQGFWPVAEVTTQVGGGGRFPVPPDLLAGFRRRLLAEDELMLMMASAILGAGILH